MLPLVLRVGYASPMTITLCIETSSAHCSVALSVGETVFKDTRLLQRTHNEHLLQMLDALYREAGLAPRQTELIAFGCGPGSFTGVRIGAAVCQAIAVASAASVVAVPSPQVYALNAYREVQVPFVLVSVRSRGDAFYMTGYQEHGSDVEMAHPTELVTTLPQWAREAPCVVGELPPWLPDSMRAAYVANVTPCSDVMVSFARQVHASGASVSAELALPMYIEGDSPWQPKATRP